MKKNKFGAVVSWIFSVLCLGGLVVLAIYMIPKEDIERASKEHQKPTVAINEDCANKRNDNVDITKPTDDMANINEEESEILYTDKPTHEPKLSKKVKVKLADIPEYKGNAYVVVNDNVPSFTDKELTTKSFEKYSDLDALGRCGVAYACIGQDIMPIEDRGPIGQVKPAGWHTVKYDCVEGKYLYNRCHLIGYQLTGENANEKNLITGTRAMNVDGMLPFENMVADYIKETNNHVMYKVTPMYEDNNLLVNGVLMEAKSVEDGGEGILFNVFVYNAQDGVMIDYSTGNSSLENNVTLKPTKGTVEQSTEKIIGNKNSKAYHRESCSRLPDEKNRVYFNSETEANAAGYDNPCDFCDP